MTFETIFHPKFVRHPRRRCGVQFQKIKFCQALDLFRERPTFPYKFNHNLCFSSFLKVDIAGITGPVQFDENGRRIVSRLDILNLRNNSFKKVSSKKSVNNHIFSRRIAYSDWVFLKTKDSLSTRYRLQLDFCKGSLKQQQQ